MTAAPQPSRDARPPDLAALLARIAERDESALGALWDGAAPALLGIALAVLRDRQEAEDVASETLLRVWRHAERFDPSAGSALAWLGTIARRIAIDRLRARRAAGAAASLDAVAFEAAWDGPAPSDAAEADDDMRRVRAALRELPAEERAALAASYFGDLSHAEIATHYGWPVGTVKSRIRNGMIRLRDALVESPEEEER